MVFANDNAFTRTADCTVLDRQVDSLEYNHELYISEIFSCSDSNKKLDGFISNARGECMLFFNYLYDLKGALKKVKFRLCYYEAGKTISYKKVLTLKRIKGSYQMRGKIKNQFDLSFYENLIKI